MVTTSRFVLIALLATLGCGGAKPAAAKAYNGPPCEATGPMQAQHPIWKLHTMWEPATAACGTASDLPWDRDLEVHVNQQGPAEATMQADTGTWGTGAIAIDPAILVSNDEPNHTCLVSFSASNMIDVMKSHSALVQTSFNLQLAPGQVSGTGKAKVDSADPAVHTAGAMEGPGACHRTGTIEFTVETK